MNFTICTLHLVTLGKLKQWGCDRWNLAPIKETNAYILIGNPYLEDLVICGW
jgi:hypothetical protein